LGQTKITVDELIRLQVGDFIALPIKEIIPVKIEGVPIMECRFGAINGRTAVRAERMVKFSRLNENFTVEENVS
jgi:flagellar motor switch protein FliM